MSLCPCREIINITLPMSDGEGAVLFCAPGYESSSHERRRAVLYRKQNGDPLFLPPTNSLTPRSFSFSRCRRISTPRASPRLSTPYRETPPCPRQSVRRRPFRRPAAGCRRHGRCFNRGRLQRCGFSKGYRFAHSNQAFYPMVKFPYLPSHRREGTFMECDSSVFSLSDTS